MSNVLTTAARPLVMDASAKAVLMALCDMAREPDDPDRPAQTWPPMRGQDGAIGLCDWTCLSERSVQRGLRALVAAGHVTRRQLRHGVIYTVHPGGTGLASCASTPDNMTPDNMTGVTTAATPVILASTPANMTPKASQSTNRRKKTTSSSSTRGGRCERVGSGGRADPFPMPDGVDPQHWRDFLANRARKRLANTASAHKRLLDDLSRHSSSKWTVPQLIEHAAGAGWAGIYAPGDRAGGRGGGSGRPRADPDELPTVAAAERAMAMMNRPNP